MKEQILKHRTAQVTLTVLGPDGEPKAGRAVTIRQTRHKFLFGCNTFQVDPADGSELQWLYQERFADLFNFATLPFYWGRYETAPGILPGEGRAQAIADWCAGRGIRTKGHPLCWHQVPPGWLADRPPEEILDRQLERIRREVKTFAGRVDTWDVVNEAVIMPDFTRTPSPVADLCRKIGRLELIRQTFAAAQSVNPAATFILNDFATGEKCEALLTECLGAGVRIDALGIQSHQHQTLWTDSATRDVCDRLSRFGKPLHFTENTLISGEIKAKPKWDGRYGDWITTPEGEELQARQVEQFYSLLFSHPAVEAVTWWDLSDHGAWMGAPAGLLRKDMTPKPAYEVLKRLVKQEWWTPEQTLTTDAGGSVHFRAFLGSHTLQSGGAKRRFEIERAGSATVVIRVGAA